MGDLVCLSGSREMGRLRQFPACSEPSKAGQRTRLFSYSSCNTVLEALSPFLEQISLFRLAADSTVKVVPKACLRHPPSLGPCAFRAHFCRRGTLRQSSR